MRPNLGLCTRQNAAPSLRYAKLAGFTTATSGAPPERNSPRHDSYAGSVPILVCPARGRPVPDCQSHGGFLVLVHLPPANIGIEFLACRSMCRLQIGFAIARSQPNLAATSAFEYFGHTGWRYYVARTSYGSCDHRFPGNAICTRRLRVDLDLLCLRRAAAAGYLPNGDRATLNCGSSRQ
jgi:hypothetical protein